MQESIFTSLLENYRKGSFSAPTIFYFSVDDIQKTVTLDTDGCTIQDGKTVAEADCFCKTSKEMLNRIWSEGYRPGIMDFMGGKIKSNAPHLLQQFLLAFGK